VVEGDAASKAKGGCVGQTQKLGSGRRKGTMLHWLWPLSSVYAHLSWARVASYSRRSFCGVCGAVQLDVEVRRFFVLLLPRTLSDAPLTPSAGRALQAPSLQCVHRRSLPWRTRLRHEFFFLRSRSY